jgi:tetratricopeptide (TPR) repeat protein
MDPEQRIHNQQMLQTYRAVLHEYELQAATMGIQTPVHVKLEIDRYRRLIAELEPQTNLPWPRHNLPPRNYEQLVGRQRELEQLGKLLDPRGRAYFVAIDGIGGIGKSALALETAYRWHERYGELAEDQRFEAIVWVSAKRDYLTAEGVLKQRQRFHTLDDLFAAIARLHGQSAGALASADAQRELAERLLAEKRTLLIIDNLETVDDEDLLLFLRMPPAQTKALVTTRQRVDGAYPVRLTGLPDTDALELIAQECRRADIALTAQEQAELVKRTGGVPLAIVWSIGLIGQGEAVNSALRRLSMGQSDIARFCFDESMAKIQGHHAHRLLMALALLEIDASREMLGHLAGLDDDEFGRDEGLAVLVKLSLVNKEADRFSLLPLTRSYTLSNLAAQPTEEQALRERWIAYLTAMAQPYIQPYWLRPDRSELRREGAHLVALANWAQQNDRRAVLVQLTPALANYYDLTGQWSETLKIGRIGLEYAKLANDRLSVIFIETYALSWILRQLGQLDEAEQYIADALATAKQVGDVTWQCETLIRYSQTLRYRQKFGQARELCEEAQRLAEGTSYHILQADIHYELGKLARDQERWEDARHHLETARAMFGHQQDNPTFNVELAWGVWSNLGFVTQQLGDLDTAADLYRQALIFARERGGRGNLITFQLRLALLEKERGNVQAALDYAREALEWSQQLGMVKEQAQAAELCALLSSAPAGTGN